MGYTEQKYEYGNSQTDDGWTSVGAHGNLCKKIP